MAKDNPTNPFSRDPDRVKKDVPMPISKAKVMAVKDHPDQFGFHVVRIRVYGDGATYLSPVIAPAHGSVWLPKEGQDVAVIFGHSDKPWVIGAWYAIDRVEDGDVKLPSYEPGDLRLGNESGAHVTVKDDGSISIVSTNGQEVSIGGTTIETAVENPLSVPHTEWSTALDKEEIWHIELDSDERLVPYRLATNFKGGGSSSDFTLDIYDVDSGTVIASTDAGQHARGDPIGQSELGSTVIARLTNATGDRQVADISSKIAIAIE